MALAGLVAARCMQVGMPVPLAIAAGLSVGILMGWINGTLVAACAAATLCRHPGDDEHRPRPGLWHDPGLVRHQSAGRISCSLDSQTLPSAPGRCRCPLCLALGVTLLVELLLSHTVFGGDIYAISSGERALLVSGVNVVRLKIVVYTLCGLLAAIGGPDDSLRAWAWPSRRPLPSAMRSTWWRPP